MNGIITGSPRPGQAHQVMTPEAIAAVEAIVKENRSVTVNEIAAHLDMSHGSAHHIVMVKRKKNYFNLTYPCTLSFFMYVCMYVYPSAWNNSALTRRTFIKFGI